MYFFKLPQALDMITLKKLLVYVKMFKIYYHNNWGGDKTSSREESNIFWWKEVTRKFLKNILTSDFGTKSRNTLKNVLVKHRLFNETRQEDINTTEWDVNLRE